MDKIPEIVAASISRNIEDVNRISSNTQNVNTVGFKALVDNSSSVDSTKQNIGKTVDLSSGEIRQTGRTLDLAVQGDGWFVLRKGNAVMLTRNGQLQLDSQGYISRSNGYRLQGTNGDIQLESTLVAIQRDGRVSFDERDIGQIFLVSVAGIDAEYYQMGNIYFDRSPRLDIDEKSKVLQGYLEQSNVDPSTEIIDLMNANRHIQTMQKSLAAYDQVIKKAISELGK
ncbi:TPA: flagellar hook-basal body protein [Vibrio cholerae]|uniref:flagellar hook-basal body protein n=1 Tax=Vibrio cholerae TaxID=666 RepID=UPI0013B40D00|nr:flagellar hook basal-body protein [Vibrio cholerae]EJY0883553.1 flagellar hook basal-body protein [Vibrio cholerae]MCR9795137.1 flagellar hook basal-body protein [Vibrio cholerae]MCX9442784.1 flagellar hook basal-body protein [Vibrio cholerae]MCX9446318.1 flagellar hook basal-body protein [Vibrio cholerae]